MAPPPIHVGVSFTLCTVWCYRAQFMLEKAFQYCYRHDDPRKFKWTKSGTRLVTGILQDIVIVYFPARPAGRLARPGIQPPPQPAPRVTNQETSPQVSRLINRSNLTSMRKQIISTMPMMPALDESAETQSEAVSSHGLMND